MVKITAMDCVQRRLEVEYSNHSLCIGGPPAFGQQSPPAAADVQLGGRVQLLTDAANFQPFGFAAAQSRAGR